MKSLGLAFFTDLHWPVFGLLIFFGLFVTILVMQILKYDFNKIKQIENLPFEGESHELK